MVRLFITLLIIALAGCAHPAMRLPKQGLTGHILEVRGNQMPGPGRPPRKGHGVSREILIYAPTTAAQADGMMPLFTAIRSKLIATTRSDSTGRYQIALPPGKYSVFIKDAGRFFATESNGEGVFNPIEVQLNTLTTKDIVINHNAAY